MRFEVTILGNNSASPAFGRHPTSQLLNIHDRLYLLDCGEGTQLQMSAFKVKRSRINHIFITHLHGDHYFGLIGLLTTYHLLKRENPLHLFGPPALLDIINLQLSVANSELCYPLIFSPVNAAVHQKIFEDAGIEVFTLPMQHRIPCCGFLFKEKPFLRSMIGDKMTEYGIPSQLVQGIKTGLDYVTPEGRIIPNAELTLAPQPPCSYAFCSDTIFNLDYAPLMKGCDLIYHESTFDNSSAARAAETFHCTAAQAAFVAKTAGVKRMLLGHYSSKYEDIRIFENEARPVFEASYATVEGETYNIR